MNESGETMKIGVRAHDYGKLPIETLIEAIKQDGFSNIQLAIPKAIEGIGGFEQITPDLIGKIKKICQVEQIEISVFGCYIEPSISDELKRQAEIDKFLKGIEYAKELGAGCIGTETTRFSGTEAEREVAFQRLVDSVRQMVNRAEEIGIDIGIEPVAYHTLATPQLTKRLLDTIQSPRLKVILDPVNLITIYNIRTQENLWQECIELFGDKICAIHIKGIKVNADDELEKVSLTECEVNFKTILKEMIKRNPEMPVLREEAIPALARLEQEFIKEQIR
ncbi:MAG: sugar phosphate isomerase/epimerase family protein [Cellulosilyticaceae bacterium]